MQINIFQIRFNIHCFRCGVRLRHGTDVNAITATHLAAVITSYSIHYTKLYEAVVLWKVLVNKYRVFVSNALEHAGRSRVLYSLPRRVLPGSAELGRFWLPNGQPYPWLPNNF